MASKPTITVYYEAYDMLLKFWEVFGDFSEENKNRMLALALKDFRKQYPSVTSADLQTFTLGFQACLEKITKVAEEIKKCCGRI